MDLISLYESLLSRDWKFNIQKLIVIALLWCGCWRWLVLYWAGWPRITAKTQHGFSEAGQAAAAELGQAGVSRPELNCDNSLRSSHQTSSPLQSSAEKSSRPTLNVIVILLQYFNSNTVTFIYWFIYLMIIRRRYLFSNKTSQNIHVKSIVLQYILLLWRPLLPDEDPGRSLNPLETGWYPKKVPEPGPGCCWCRHTVTDAWWCVTAPCNDRLLFSSGPNWISWTR